MSAAIVVNALKDLTNNKNLDRYDENLCADIKSRLDSKLREEKYSIDERVEFAKKNAAVMHKWSEVLPSGISKCLKEYFDSRSLWAPMYDPRFPNQNQAKRCFVNYVDYKRCQKIKGEDHRDCDYFKKVSGNVCPAAWIEKWEEQLETGSFPVDI